MRSRWNVQYYQKVLALDPAAYWVLDEKQGTVAYDLVSGRVAGAQNGAHVGVTLGQSGISDGRTAPFYDGVNDYTNIYSAAFAAAFNGSEGAIMAWARVANAGVWTDGIQRRIISLQIDASQRIFIYRPGVNNRLQWNYTAGAVAKVQQVDTSTLDWFCVGLAWSLSDDEVRFFFNGAQLGATQSGLGVWVGALPANGTNIGTLNDASNQMWHGDIAHVAIWNRALTAGEFS